MIAYINAFSTGHTDTASFAVIVDDKQFIYQIPGSMNRAEIKAAEFVIRGMPRNEHIELHTSNKYLIEMMEYGDNGWIKKAVKNSEDVSSLRKAAIEHGDILVVPDKVTEKMLKVREMARMFQERK